MAQQMSRWLTRIWKGRNVLPPPVTPRDQDAEVAELAALIESGDTSPESLEQIATLMGQTDPNEKF